MSKLLLFLFILQVFGAFAFVTGRSDTKQNEVLRQLKLKGDNKFLIKKDSAQNSKDILLEAFNYWVSDQRPGNLTFIGWQTILNEDGTVKEVRTVELAFLGDSADVPYMTADFSGVPDEDAEIMAPDVVHFVKDIKTDTGFEVVTSVQNYNYNGVLRFGLFVDSRDIFIPLSEQYSDIGILVRNLTVKSLDDVKQFEKDNVGSIPSSMLVYDNLETEKIKLSESTIVPLGLIWQVTNFSANESMAEEAAVYILSAYLSDKETAGDYILSHMTESYPSYKWLVTEDNDYNHEVAYDIRIELSYRDNVFARTVKPIELYAVTI